MTTDQATEILGVRSTSVNHMNFVKKLKAMKIGRDWMVFIRVNLDLPSTLKDLYWAGHGTDCKLGYRLNLE